MHVNHNASTVRHSIRIHVGTAEEKWTHRDMRNYSYCDSKVPLTSGAGWSSPSRTTCQSRTPPFQSAIRPSRTRTVTTRTSSSMEILGLRWPGCCCCCWPKSPISSSKVLFSRCCSLHQASSSEPGSRTRAEPAMVVEILDSALVFRFNRRLAKDERVAAGGGDPSR